MSTRISLLSTEEPLLDYLNMQLSAGAYLEFREQPESLYHCLENNSGAPDIIVLGLNVQEPIRIAEHILVLNREVKIVILSTSSQQKILHKAIQFSPFLNSDVISFKFDDKQKLLNMLQSLVDNIEKQRVYANTIAGVEKERKAILPTRPLVANYLDTLLDRIPIGIINLDAKRRILNLNRRAQSLLKYSERELVGKIFPTFFSPKEALNIEQMVADCINVKGKNNSQIVCVVSSDVKSYLDISISLISGNTSEAILTVIMQEVTDKVLEEKKRKKAEKALKENEQQLSLVIDSIPELIAYVDADLAYQFNNKAFENWFGFTRDEIKGKKVWQVIGKKPYEVLEKYVKKVMAGVTITFEEKLNYPYRGEVYIRCTYIPNFDDECKVCGFFVLTSDITQSKNNEEGEKKHLLELAHTSRIITLGEMSSQLSHELAQPLTSIETYSRACIKLIEKGRIEMPDIKDTFENISAQAMRAHDVMHELRNFAKKDASRTNVSINDLIKSAIKLLQIEYREHKPDINLDLSEALPQIYADRTLIEQVLINLVKNALEAMEALEKSKRNLTLQTELLKGSEIMVSVHDSGPGLSDYEFSKIFEAFYTTKPEGMGMGLAITRSVIDAHGGEIKVMPNSLGGTTFNFTLPTISTH
ncbi:MAG: PAS domain-containing protein [Gammaproteobacteria bacterium]